MDKKEIEKEEKKEVVTIGVYTLIFVVLTVSFALVTIALAIAVNSWVFEAWGFVMFLLPIYAVVLWRRKIAIYLRKRVEA